MNAIVFDEPYKFKYVEIPDPVLGDNDIVVKVMAVGVCGSDMHRFKGELPFPKGTVMGHEFSGEVVEVGKNVTNFVLGDKVVPYPLTTCKVCEMCRKGAYHLCNNGYFGDAAKAFAEYVKLDTTKDEIYHLPDKLSYEEGAFVEPLAVALNAVQKSVPKITNNVVVLGAGPIGMLITAVLTTLPVKIAVTDVSEKRLNFAKELGAHHVINAKTHDVKGELMHLFGSKRYGVYHEGPDVDMVYEAAGAPQTFPQALEIVRAQGTVVVAAYANPPITFDPNIIPQKEINIIGSFCYTEEFQQAIDLIASREIDFTKFISHMYPLDKTQEAFEKQADTENSIKVIVKPFE